MSELFDPRAGARLSHAGTFNANPMTMAAGLAAMRQFDEAAFIRLAALGQRLRDGLNEALRISGRQGVVTGATSLAGLFLIDRPIATYRDLVALMGADPGVARRSEALFRHLLNHGVLTMQPGFFALSTATKESEVDHVAEAALSGLRSLPA
jgi:glutamate-1-semialdehyde 2,1-aminomutase